MPDAPALPAGVREEEATRRGAFTEFMTRVARFEDLVDGGRQFLARFRQELEYFQRPPVPTGSDVMREIVGSNCTGRMTSYLEAGCSLHCRNISNLNQYSCERELEEHINKVSVLLKELQCLVEAAYDSTITTNLSAIEVPDDRTIDNKMNNESHFMEDKEEQPAHQVAGDSSLVTVMILVHNMLKLDYMMQRKIHIVSLRQ